MRARCIGVTTVVALITILLFAAGPVSAKKPPKPPPEPPPQVDTGTIYYLSGTSDPAVIQVNSMGPDGSGKTPLLTGAWGMPFEPSASLHACATHGQDERWFLTFRPVGNTTYPNGIARHELFAVCEGGTAVQLTSDAGLEPDNAGQAPEFSRARPRWCDGDTQVSYLAKRWSGGVVVAWGIYTLTIQPGSLHLHNAGSPSRIGVDLVLMMPDDERGGICDAPYDWKPDGTAFVYKARGGSSNKGLIRADFDASSGTWSTSRLTSGDEYEVRWSPGSTARIVFESGTGDIDSMDPYNSSDRTTLIENPATRKKNLKVFRPFWSPNGTHLVYDYQLWSTDPRKAFSDVYRATASGSDGTNLTSDTDDGVSTLGWR